MIHPGSRWLRIGRASDAFPIAVPNVIARKQRGFTFSTITKDKGKQREDPPPAPTPTASRPPLPSQADMEVDQLSDSDSESPRDDSTAPTDPLSAKISSIRGDLRARMRAFKLRGQGNGNAQAMAYNETVVPEVIAEHGDPGEIEWTPTEGEEAREVYVGEKVRFWMLRRASIHSLIRFAHRQALRIPDAEAAGYLVRRPFGRGGLDTTGYTSQQELLGDVEKIWLTTLEEELGITKTELKVSPRRSAPRLTLTWLLQQDYSAILLLPDLYDDVYVREMTDVVLKWIGFKQICLEQVSTDF